MVSDAPGRDQRGIFAEQQLLHRNVVGGTPSIGW
jgi:hypothetical protein